MQRKLSMNFSIKNSSNTNDDSGKESGGFISTNIMNKRGFTLIELLIVLAIVGIVVAMIAGVINSGRNQNNGLPIAAEPVSANDFNEVNKFDFEGHSYIYFQDGWSDHKAAGIVHSPECECQKKKD